MVVPSIFKGSKDRGEGFGTKNDPTTCRVFRDDSDQTIATGTYRKIVFNGTSWDEGKMSNGAGDITIPVSGYYIVQCNLSCKFNGIDLHKFKFTVNGTQVLYQERYNPHITAETMPMFMMRYFNEGDVISVWMRAYGEDAKVYMYETYTHLTINRISTGGL